MKRTVISLICPIIIGLFFTSCLPDAEEAELSSSVALLSFSINDQKTQYTITLDNGKDSTYTVVMNTSDVRFSIDHEQGLVYNVEPIAYGTDVTHVVPSMSADGYVFYYKGEERMGYSSGDTVNFANPVKFTIVSYDEKFSRDYLIRINVSETDPKVTYWEQIEATTFPSGLFVAQKAVARDGQLYVFGSDAEGKCYTTLTAINDGVQWSDATEWSGVEAGANIDYSSVTLFGEQFYVLVSGTLYRSADGIAWEVAADDNISCLFAVTEEVSPTVWGVSDNVFVSSTDMLTWNTTTQYATNGIKRVAYFNEALRTNPYIQRTIVVGTLEQTADTCAKVWSKLSTEKVWTEVVPIGSNIYGCPNLENLAVISYRGMMYAFGGKSLGMRNVPIEAFEACYESRDNGVTWRVRENAFSLSKDFVGREERFSAIVDNQDRVWIIWSESGEVWRGTWNGEDA